MTRTIQTNIRLSIFARRQLDALCNATGMNQSEVIQTALDRFHQSEMIEAWQVADGADPPAPSSSPHPVVNSTGSRYSCK